MADDTRQWEDLSKEALNVNPDNRAFTGGQWQEAQKKVYKPPENANMIPGGTQNTAGGKVPEVTLSNAFEGGLKLKDFTELPQRPCVRDALMAGIGAGFAFGGVRAIFGATVWTACSWFVGTLCTGSAGMYQWCLYKRSQEKEGMMRAMEIMNKRDVEKKAREQQREKAREERRKLKEQDQENQFAALRESRGGDASGKPWWKLW